MSIKTTIDKVPVEFEIKSVGPAAIEDIDKFRENLISGKIVVIKKSQEPNPYLNPDIKEEQVLTVDEPKEVAEPQKVEVDLTKPWWSSKTIIANILTAAGCALATFLTDNPDMATYLPISALAAINLVLRSISKEPIKLPFKSNIKTDSDEKLINNV